MLVTALIKDDKQNHIANNEERTFCGKEISKIIPTPTYAITLCKICVKETVKDGHNN